MKTETMKLQMVRKSMRGSLKSKPCAHGALDQCKIFGAKGPDASDELRIGNGYQILRVKTPAFKKNVRAATSNRPPRGLVVWATTVTKDLS